MSLERNFLNSSELRIPRPYASGWGTPDVGKDGEWKPTIPDDDVIGGGEPPNPPKMPPQYPPETPSTSPGSKLQ